ncbi:MAG: glycosyltransferase [Candidatus Andersenbacteria bacterium]|nr:glycosyltransferase [Candidatus Andersenbacteria bacterium]
MRIVHTCLRYPPASGGVETYAQAIVERTRNIDAKRDVRVITSRLRTHGPVSELNPALLLDEPLYVHRLQHATTPFISYPRLEALPYYIGHHQPTILESYSFWYQPADITASHARRYHIPFIFHPMYYENEIRQKTIWQLYKKTIGHRTFAAADVVVVISPQEKELIRLANMPVKRFELIPPGVDVHNSRAPKLNPFLKRGIRGNIILSVSRLAPGKKLEDAITAMAGVIKAHGDAQLVFIGEDFGSRHRLEALAASLGLSQHVHFTGSVSQDELMAAYEHADVLLHTSEYEAFGIAVAESLAAGTPVVVRRVGAIPFVAPEGLTSLQFNTVDEIPELINTLLGDTNLRQRLGNQGQQYVQTNFTWEKSIKKLVKLYDELSQ